MISLKNKTNAIQPTSTYPYGKLKDDSGIGDGTPISQATNNDIHSFLQRLMVDGGLTPNEILDNEYDGFQLNTALGNMIRNLAGGVYDARKLPMPAWVNIPVTGASWANNVGTLKYRISLDGKVHISGNIKVTTYSTNVFASTPAALASMQSVINTITLPMIPIAGATDPYLIITATNMSIGVNSGVIANGGIAIFNGMSFWPDENS